MYAKITAHKGFLIVELLAKKSIPGAVTTNLDKPSCVGSFIHKTKDNLGISIEALDILKRLKRSKKGLGEMDWSKDEAGQGLFGWVGGAKRLIDPKLIEVSPSWQILEHTSISNEVPSEVKALLHKRVMA